MKETPSPFIGNRKNLGKFPIPPIPPIPPIVPIALACVMLILAPAQMVHAGDDGWKIATNKNIPGKNGWTTCEVFARSLYRKLTEAGGEAHLLVFEWTNGYGQVGRHALVVFRDSAGQYWSMDNRAERPTLLKGASAQRWLQHQYQGYRPQLVSAKTDSRFRGQYASLNRVSTQPKTLVASNTVPVQNSSVAANSAYATKTPARSENVQSDEPENMETMESQTDGDNFKSYLDPLIKMERRTWIQSPRYLFTGIRESTPLLTGIDRTAPSLAITTSFAWDR